MKNDRRSRGFSMIEVLVTIVLICIGVLGMVAMQGRTIAYTQDAVQRNTAAHLADDLLEMMRADLNEVLEVSGGPSSTSSYFKAKSDDFPDAPDDCSSLAELNASQRLGCWASRVEASLPGADTLMDEVHICRTLTTGSCSGTGSTIEIQLAWSVKGSECLDPSSENSDVCHYRVRVEL